MKKLLTIFVIVLFLLLLIGSVWFFFFGNTNSGIDIVAPDTEDRVFFPTSPPEEDIVITEEDTDPEAPIPPVQIIDAVPVLRQITDRPTAGFGVFDRTREEIIDIDGNATTTADQTVRQIEETVYRYIERATGHIYEANDKTLTLTRLSNITIPRIQEGFVGPGGDDFIFRYFSNTNNTIETYSAALIKNESATSTDDGMLFDGQFLPTNINEVAYGPDKEFVYITGFPDIVTGDISVYTSDAQSIGKRIFTSPLSEWIPQWVAPNLVTLTSKADSRVTGFVYNINPLTGATTVALSNIKGLTTNTSPEGKYILYSESRPGRLDLFVLDTDEGTKVRLNINTLPEKCVWSTKNETTLYCASPTSLPNADYPEDWYQGTLTFTDTLWKIDVDIQSYRDIIDPTDGRFDIIKPTLSTDDEYFTFINKKDLSLWTLQLNEPLPRIYDGDEFTDDSGV